MVDKVMDFGKKLLERIKEWWNKFQPKQKTLIIGIAVVILLAIAILVAVQKSSMYRILLYVNPQRRHLLSRNCLMDRALYTKYHQMDFVLMCWNHSSQMQTCCLVQTTFRQQHTPLMMC